MMQGIFKWVSSLKIWVWVGIVFSVLIGLIKISSMRNTQLEEDISEAERQMELQAHNNEVKEFQAINTERKDVANAELDKEFDALDIKLNGNTTYSL